MFKLESYITPILLSYVDRYIKNFKLEDSQVSLWGGDASFHNLELRLDVLEQELQLPFSFVSGHIRELLIHVPWTKLNSQPITITINTIECILKLRGSEATSSPESSSQAREKIKKQNTKQDIEAPPGYVQLLINKIVSNIRIYCNNLILKYVEEDIVLSMNVKHLKFESANEKWEPAYTDLSPAQVILRKIVAVNDLTLCLDKRNAAGKIDVYQEPMLYRCSMTMHLLRHYHSATAKRASTTRLDIYCNNMEFSMTEQQVPMLLRLMMLLYALQQKQLKPDTDIHVDHQVSPELRDSQEKPETWTNWAWSYVSSVLPTQWDEEWNNEQLKNYSGHTMQIGFYVDNMSITFKVSESGPSDRGYYAQKKLKYWPMLQLQLQGIYSESIVHGIKWLNASFGVSQAVLVPLGPCSCAVAETPAPYLKIGSATTSHKADSLFDAAAVENKGHSRNYNTSWEHHMLANTESVLLERTPAIALDYVYQMEIPEDMTSERLSELGSDYEFSNLSEMSSLRVCFGPFKLKLCSGFFHRMQSLRVAGSYYDYMPYHTPKPDLPLNELLPPSEEDFDALNEFISSRSTRVTFFAPIIELQLMDHPYFAPTKGTLFRKRKKSAGTFATSTLQELPKLTIECQFLDISVQTPMYVNRLVHTTCQLPDPPKQLFEACYHKQTIKILGLCSRLMVNQQKHTTILTPCSASYTLKSMLKPQYWTNSNIPHQERVFESESITVNGTKAKMMVIHEIADKIIKMEPSAIISMSNSTLLNDAAKDYGLPYIEFCIEGIRFKKVTTNSVVSVDLCAGSIKAFIFEPAELKGKDRDLKSKKDAFSTIQQVLFISGPEPRKPDTLHTKPFRVPESELPLLSATVQYPLTPDSQTHPPILIFNLQEIRVCVDPLVCRWLLYTPKNHSTKVDHFDPIQHIKKNISEASGSAIETPRRFSQLESVHSSSDRDQVAVPHRVLKTLKEEEIDLQEQIYNVLKKWFDVWKGMLICGDLSQCTIYFPMETLSSVGSQGIQEAIEQAIGKDNPPEIMVVQLPFANIISSQRQNLNQYLKSLPVILPASLWTLDKSSFPWTMSISDLSCYTLQFGKKLIFLRPVSLSATVGLSTKPCKPDQPAQTEPEKPDLGYLGVCIHIDMTPVVVSTSEVQVYLFASILYGLMEVVGHLAPEPSRLARPPEPVPPMGGRAAGGSSAASPTVVRENTDSASGRSPPLSAAAAVSDKDAVKLTAWVQWTVTRFTMELLSNEHGQKAYSDTDNLKPHLKLVIDAEDIVSSLDFQSVYLKIKSKVGSLSVQHYKRTSPTSKWRPGPFSGIVMRLQEDVSLGQRHEDSGFISVTITRASCKHTHTLWGAVQKNKKDNTSINQLSATRYITEIVVNVQPIDFVLSLKTLRSFYLVLVPLLQIPKPENQKAKDCNVLPYLNNQTLPLAYVDCQDIRVIMPSIDFGSDRSLHDVYVFQVHKISLSPSAVNPICRVPVRPDIYEQAAHARILNIPGSEVEDRQYQLDIIGMSISTGPWKDIDSVLSPSGSNIIKSMSENPALEWNNLEQGQPNMVPNLNLLPVTDKFDISIVAAPAMIYQESTVICGNSMEINFVSDIIVYLSLQQIKLTSALITEFVYLLEPFIKKDEIAKRPKIRLPYSNLENTYVFEEDDEGVEALKDSGIDTSEMRSLKSFKAIGLEYSTQPNTESEKQYVFPRPPNPIPHAYNCVPIDILFTAGKIIFSLYKVEIIEQSGSKLSGKKKKIKEFDEDLGYEASEESVEEAPENHKTYTPLIYLALNQPNCFVSKQQLARKFQVSCFDLNVKFSSPEYLPVGHVPTEPDFPINLLETKSGNPHASTGILPAFITVRLSRGLSKNATLDVDVSRPIKLLCSSARWTHLLLIYRSVLEAFVCEKGEASAGSACFKEPGGLNSGQRSIKYGETYSKFQEIKNMLNGIHCVNITFDQLLFAAKSPTGHEVLLSFNNLKNELQLFSRPEKITNSCTLSCITLVVVRENFKKILLNPWTLSFEVCLFWESWQTADSEPQVQVSAESDCIVFDVSPDHVECVEMVLKDLQGFLKALPAKKKSHDRIGGIETAEKDQYYKDDLRAGAFQFVDANMNNADELPLPYQVMFWTKNVSAMAWRYPQPRALTKVRVFPVPYKITLDVEDDLQVLCKLEYWSDCRNCYLPYTEFYLSESEVCHLALPKTHPQTVVACTWRVVINTINHTETDSNLHNMYVSPRALAACMRIDSYFNKTLIPNFAAALYITKIDVNLYSYVCRRTEGKLPNCLKNFKSDYTVPENQKFLILTWDNLTSYFTSWNLDMLSLELSSSTKCSVLDYTYLTEQPVLEPFTYKLEMNVSDALRCNFVSRPIQIRFCPNIAHTLAVSGQLWSQCRKTNETDFVIVTRYVVCNDTNVNVRFGQTGTEEDILLPPRHFHLYCWRTQKRKQEFKVALEESEWIWSRSIRIQEDGMQMVKLNSDKNLKILVSIKSLSSTQKQITIAGQLIVTNMLLEHFELKVVKSVPKENKDAEFKAATIHIANGREPTPSILLNSHKEYFLRLRFLGLESTWTGDIPLREHSTGSQPWLVKVPLQERGQFLSIWCRIVTQEIDNTNRIMAMLWPLFTIKSNLPLPASVHIETPLLNVKIDSSVNGKGELQQLYCPGTIDHSHQLSFQLDNGITTTNPYVPLNYSLVDQQNFFKKMDKEDIDDILKVLDAFSETKWPYFGDDVENINWDVDEQPLTHVQVRYLNACTYSSSLMVELLPWCMVVNTFGVPISLMLSGTQLLLCQIKHNGIVAPPKLEENFNIGIFLNGDYYSSVPLQLAKSDWGQTFYMPKITGTIPMEGNITVPVDCHKYIAVLSICSAIANEIRLLKVSSTHLISNLTNVSLEAYCFAVPDVEIDYDLPKYRQINALILPPNQENAGMSIMQWYNLTGDFENTNFAFYVTFSAKPELGWSCPIRVDKTFIRKSFCILGENYPIPLCITFQEYKGQTYLAVSHDLRPQIFIENKSNIPLICAQFLTDNSTANESQHFKWNCEIKRLGSMFYSMPLIGEKFPEIPQNSYLESIVFGTSTDSDDSKLKWSEDINITLDNEKFVRIPYFGDVKMTIINTAVFTHITVESVSQVEISARDIRVRLSMNTTNGSPNEEAKEKQIPSSTSSFASNIEEFQSTSSKLPTLGEHHKTAVPNVAREKLTDVSSKKSILVQTIPTKGRWNSLKVKVFLKSFSFILSTELNTPRERCELASLTCDNIALSVTQTEVLNLNLIISDMQFDNQLYSRESYDFPVVFIGQNKNPERRMSSLNIPMDKLLDSQDNAVLVLEVNLESCFDHARNTNITGAKTVSISFQPVSCYIEDVYLSRLADCLKIFSPNKLVLWPAPERQLVENRTPGVVIISDLIAWQCVLASVPLTVKTITIAPVSILLSVHCSVKIYIALDQSPLQFGKFERKRLATTPYKLGHTLTMHYLSGAIFRAGWVVSSLELLGSPGGLARAMGSGLRDFVSLPYRGLVQGPMAFLRGVTQGSASLMWHVTSGTLQSVTKLASSVARNLDRLTLDEEHLRRTEEQRRQRPQGLAQGFMQGMTGLGISLLGAVGGIAHHPLQSVMSDGASPRSLAAGVGLGLVGVITKPLSGAAELLALTGQGLLQGAGWTSLPEARNQPVLFQIYTSPNSIVKYSWKLTNSLSNRNIIYVTEATSINNTQYEAIALILTTEALMIINTDEDRTDKVLSLAELSIVQSNDPTLLVLKLTPPPVVVKQEDENVVEMDPVSRARVADYVKNTVGILNMPDGISQDRSDISISPLSSPRAMSTTSMADVSTIYSFYVNPQNRNYFLCLLSLTQQRQPNYHFPVL
ncbi:unnamed protein product [Brassicogethes aeneus]|uniref:Vacuolar protein sorting-associated protein 13B n=1 Tax=Brassicogethes aeneus TaxID=1431903 RepID=A0A9P0FGD9_BRAAE|nr:unnamed protein product [Brassicogethes aeneus]